MIDASDADAAGWYPDPAGVHHQRYWSGDAWTARVADAFGVSAAHHLEHDYSAPGGGPARVPATPPKAPTPTLSLVTSTTAEPPTSVDVEVVRASISVPEAEELASAPLAVDPIAQPSPAAGWYPDPCGIHRERSWDGNTWSAVVIDRNRTLSAHQLHERYPRPLRHQNRERGA